MHDRVAQAAKAMEKISEDAQAGPSNPTTATEGPSNPEAVDAESTAKAGSEPLEEQSTMSPESTTQEIHPDVLAGYL